MATPALILAGASLAGAGVNSLGGKSAAKSQAKSASEALDFAKQEEASRKAEYDQSMELYKQQWNAWNAQRMGLLQRYGVDVSGMNAQLPMGPSGPAMGANNAIPVAGSLASRGVPLSGMRQPVPTAAGASTVDELLAARAAANPDWNDWGRYGLREA